MKLVRAKMGLDIRFTRRNNIICPNCGEIVGHADVDCIDAGGRGWYPFLESIGYYVPYEQRTEENDWYGKDMVLTEEQADELYQFAKKHDLYRAHLLTKLIAEAIYENDSVVVNADW
jgi:hypothetical protein